MLMRIARGSGLPGLAGIKRKSERDGVALLRPLLAVAKTRLTATLHAAGIAFAEDPSNEDPRFTRVRLRRLGAELAAEGLDGARLAGLARRLARADAALEAVVDERLAGLSRRPWPEAGPVELDAAALFKLPDEISIRMLARAIERAGDEGPVELGKLETLYGALVESHAGNRALKRTLAGAAVSLEGDVLTVTRAPARHSRTGRS
jgi:tRNA(Ile)-lysidine synthase